MEITARKSTIDSTVKQKLNDMLFLVSWREVANQYFTKSSSWLYHKLDGIDGNGGIGGFTEEEKEKLRDALFDISNRIRSSAEKI